MGRGKFKISYARRFRVRYIRDVYSGDKVGLKVGWGWSNRYSEHIFWFLRIYWRG